MNNTAIQHSSRFNADIEFNPRDPSRLHIDDEDREHLTYWGIDDEGHCYFITFIDGEFYDSETEEA